MPLVRTACIATICFPLLFVGCSGSNRPTVVPVSGKITFQGEPVEGAQIAFHPTAEGAVRSAVGETDANGEFTLTTFDTGDGATPGEHVVTIFKAPPAPSVEFDMDDPGDEYDRMMNEATTRTAASDAEKSTVPAKYAGKETSPEKRTVVEGEDNVFNIELKE